MQRVCVCQSVSRFYIARHVADGKHDNNFLASISPSADGRQRLDLNVRGVFVS
jgi:hypothetical protein